MNIVITGSNGQLGSELIRILKSGISALGAIPPALVGANVVGVDIDTLDITDEAALKVFFEKQRPDIVINCAAFTNVDRCETDLETAQKVNAQAPAYIAKLCSACGAKLVHISTDYVFSGSGNTPFTEADETAPQSAYGSTKLAGETAVLANCEKSFIVRTAWLYGYTGANFVKTIMKAAREKGELTVVNDQLGNPTNAADLAHHVLKLAASEFYGVYHCTNNGMCSWYDFACAIVELANIKATVRPCTTQEYPRPAKRPAYSALENAHLKTTVGDEMRTWREALQHFFANYKEV